MLIPFEEILHAQPTWDPGLEIGRSREGRPIRAYRFGTGGLRVSLLGGCHADEPVGPELLRRLVSILSGLPRHEAALADVQWWIVPHANPDGWEANRRWAEPVHRQLEAHARSGLGAHGYDPVEYLRSVVRELPGDDMEFGFPRSASDPEARPENRSIRSWWESAGGFDLHASLHGMSLAAGPWFLVEPAWVDRLVRFRARLTAATVELGHLLHDVDRRGEKGFRRVAPGFCTRPDSRAMAEYFEALHDPETAARFRPSSMETIRSMGGDPLTLVSEMPLFVRRPAPAASSGPESPQVRESWRRRWGDWHARLQQGVAPEEIRAELMAAGVRSMPVADQWRLQWMMIEAGIDAARTHAGG